MKSNGMKRVYWTIGQVVAFAIAYLLCRFAFYEFHQMKQWPNLLAIVGFALLVVGVIFNYKRLSIFTTLAYVVGFVLAMLFNKDGLDPGGGRTNNAWLIWGITFVLIILIGVIWEIINSRQLKNKQSKE